MHKELSMVINMGLALIAMALLLSLIVFTVSIGLNVKNYAIDKANDIERSVISGTIESLMSGDAIMPTAAAYGLLQSSVNTIIKTDCHVCGKVNGVGAAGACLIGHLQGRVRLSITKITEGQYEVIIYKGD